MATRHNTRKQDPVPAKRDLTPQQHRFVREYFEDLNPTQAALRCGAKPSMAQVTAAGFLENPLVQEAIAAHRKLVADYLAMSQAEILSILADVARAKITDVIEWGMQEVAIPYDADGKKLPFDQLSEAAMVRYVEMPWAKPKSSAEIPAATAAAVASVKITKDGQVEVRMHPKLEALEKLMRHLGLFEKDVQRHEVSGPDGAPIQVNHGVAIFALPDNGRNDSEVINGLPQLTGEVVTPEAIAAGA